MWKGAGLQEPEAAAVECKVALDELCKLAAGYRQLVLGVGSSADPLQRRLALLEGSHRGCGLSQGLHNQLQTELTRLGVEAETEHLGGLSTLEMFLQALGWTHHLSLLFPLQEPSWPGPVAGNQKGGPRGWAGGLE